MDDKNTELWDKVCETDPAHTKKVNMHGGFTAIDAMYQVRTATEQFGKCGEGWGFFFSDPIFPPNGTVVIKCTVWTVNKEDTVEQYGQKALDFGSKADEDCFKKAATDGLTKCLSYLGFNADVFLGKFDDNKYVETLRKKKEVKKPSLPVTWQLDMSEAYNKIDQSAFDDGQVIWMGEMKDKLSGRDKTPPTIKQFNTMIDLVIKQTEDEQND